jgi:hypothetical protein
MRNECCDSKHADDGYSRSSRARTARRAVSWIVPSAILALMPKCPFCLVAYIAVFTGCGISLAAASFAWWLVVIGCITALIYLAATTIRGIARLP